MSVRGWVYVIDNAAMPGLVKVGYSTKDPMLRAGELAATGIPHPFRLVFDVLVENPRDVEQAAHAMLRSEKEGKEWFRCSHAAAVAAIRSCCGGKILLERISVPIEAPSPPPEVETKCWDYGCARAATTSYHGNWYCAEHANARRAARFDMARRLRDEHK